MFLEYLGLSAIGKKVQLKVSVAIISWTYTVLSDGSLIGSVCVFLSETLKTDQVLPLWSLYKSHTL